MKNYEVPRPNGDLDDRTPLPAGSEIISVHGIRFKIKNDAVVRGGSALIYRVSRAGSYRKYILKECYPYTKNLSFKRDLTSGSALPVAENAEAEELFDLVKRNMRRENEIGELIANQTGRMIAPGENLDAAKIIVDGRELDAAGCYFILFEDATASDKRGWFLKDLLEECARPIENDMPLRTGNLPAPPIAAAVMEELLKALRDVHLAGYVHGDINDSNIFFMGCDPQNSDIGVGQLLDFGNALKLEADGKTLPIKNIFSTSGYWAPEILENKGDLRLTAAADIYSAGCLMLYLFKGMRYKKVYGRNLAKNISAATFLPVKKIMQRGYNRESANLFSKILSKAFAYNPDDRYQNADEMLKDIIFLKKILDPPKFNLSPNLSRSPYFVSGSRDKEIACLQAEIDAGKSLLWIWGIGGIGKTELAMEFARKQIENGRAAYLATFRSSIKETVLNLNFSGWHFEFDGQGDASDLEYRARIDLLKENCKDVLLIIDNFDDEKKSLAELQREPAYKDLLGLDMKILFTTRSRPNNFVPELQPLDEESALTLFKSVMKISPDEENIIRKLIREVDCHPMTVEILAHTLNESWGTLSPKELLARLKDAALNSSTDPEVLHKKGGSVREAKIYNHLRTLFNLFNIEDSYREILCHTTLLPIDGFEASEFILSETDAKKKQLKQLEGRGWLRRRAENNSLWIHPLVRSIFLNELKPTNDDCSNFLSTLWRRLDDRFPQEKKLFRQAAELFEGAAKNLGDQSGEHHFHAGFCHIVSDNFVKALTLEEKAIRLQEANPNKNNLDFARNCNDAGVAACYMKDYSKGMSYFEKAVKVLESCSPDDPNAANILTNIANAWLFLGDYKKALPLAERAVKIFEKTPPKNQHELANAYSVLGNIFMWLKKFDEAKPNFMTAAAILEKTAPEGSAELARAYLDIGQLAALAGDEISGEKYLLKAIAVQEKLLSKNHPDKIMSFRVLSGIYFRIGNVEAGEKYADAARKALQENLDAELKDTLSLCLDTIELRGEKMLPVEFIAYHKTAASCYRQLGNLDSAKKFLSAALEKIPETNSPQEISDAFFEASNFCEAQKNFEEAISYFQKALSIVQKNEPDNFEKLSSKFMTLADLFFKAKKLEEALTCYEKSIQIQLQSPYPNFDFVKLVKKFVGITLRDLNRTEEARAVFEKLLAEWKEELSDFHPTIKELENLAANLSRKSES